VSKVSRRTFLAGSATAGALTVAAIARSDGGSDPARVASDGAPDGPRYLPFRGAHQIGVTGPVGASPAGAAILAAFDVTAEDREDLAATLRDLSDEIEGLMTGRPYEERDPALPPLHTGALGMQPVPTELSVVVSVGASLFDDRFGLADRKPRELVAMPFMANDRLDPARTHGDVLLQLSADSPDACLFALRQLMRRTRAGMVLRWIVEGFNRRDSEATTDGAPVRNLLGFKDGTENLPVDDDPTLDRFVWVADGDDEPAWTAGGSYQAVRIIRMLVEFWDRTPLAEQEAIIGRRKGTGAPFTGQKETDTPEFGSDPDGKVTPLDAHIRLANPRTKETEGNKILRRGFSYSRGFDASGALDQGLAFVSYQRSLEQGFLAVQGRLNGEPLEEYIRGEGGGFFFALPGVPAGSGSWLGEGLLA
jgi:deferrochelatase/peroxidase EfeB